MIKKVVICIFLTFISCQTFSQEDPDTALIKRKLQVSLADTNRVRLLLTMGKVYFENSSNSLERVDTASNYTQQVIKLSKFLHYQPGLASGLLLQSNVYRKRGNTRMAQLYLDSSINMIKRRGNPVELGNAYLDVWFRYVQEADAFALQMRYYKTALEILGKTNDKLSYAYALSRVANLYRYAGDNKTALVYMQKAVKIYKEKKFPLIYLPFEAIGWIYVQLGDIQSGLEYDLQAAAIAEKLKVKSLTLSVIYNSIGIMFARQNIYDKALVYYRKSLLIAEYNRNQDHIRNLHANIASVLLKMGKTAEALQSLAVFKKYPPTDINMTVKAANMFIEAYLRLKDFKKAENYYLQLRGINRDKVASADVRELILIAIINYLQATGQFRASLHYLESYKPYWKNSGSFLKESQGELLSFRTDSGLSNYLSAINHHVSYKAMSDSLLDKDKARQFNQLTLKFETEKKDKELIVKEQKIKMLDKQAQLQHAVLEHERSIRKGVVGGCILLVAFFGLGYSRYRLKQRSNRKLEEQQAEINKQNELLRKVLHEKEWLLKEIHHRVKNNLQIVISLLNSQLSFLDNPDALDAIRNSQHRMHAMSLIHQKLYQSDNLATIDMALYIRDLVEYLAESFGKSKYIKMNINVCPIKLDVAQAVPLGLILNEAISNAIKYAFPDNESGTVSVELEPAKDGRYLLCIADNGNGLPEGFDPYDTSSLGMSLMQGLTEQLEGEFFLEEKNGLQVCITFNAIEFTQPINSLS